MKSVKEYCSTYRMQLVALVALMVTFLIDPAMAASAGLTGGVIMAVANTKSTIVANADNAPRLESKLWYDGARVYESVSTVEVLVADDDNSIYRFFRVRSNWRVSSLETANDAIAGLTAADFGLWDTAENGGAVVSGQLWGSAIDINAGGGFTDRTYEATPTNIAVCDKQIWELAGLAADPQKEYDICMKCTTIGAAAGTVSARLRYIKGQ